MPVALVTGSSTGIGQATAISLARAGYVVHAAMRNPAAAGELEKVAAAEGLDIRPIKLDVDDDASVAGAFAAVGQVDVLINNAGIGGGYSVEETPLWVFRGVMETNYFGILRCTQAVLPQMRERKSGLIVNVTSLSGRVAIAPQAAYAASKFAVEAISECLAQEMKPFGVRVAVVEPGLILTPIFGKAPASPAPADSPYPHSRRIGAAVVAAMPHGSSPFLVGDLIAGIATGTSEQLRYRVGHLANEVFTWRQGISDEAFIAVAGGSDADYAMAWGGGIDVALRT
jgi:NAD(P)-dependent dehydrogenase (short-subunit alcohol dehydrogenase family)